MVYLWYISYSSSISSAFVVPKTSAVDDVWFSVGSKVTYFSSFVPKALKIYDKCVKVIFWVGIGKFVFVKGLECGGQDLGGPFFGGLGRGLGDCGRVMNVEGAFGIKAAKRDEYGIKRLGIIL